jgi:subtilisin family serine protease
MSRRSILFIIVAFFAIAPLIAWARSAERVLPGQKVFGELGPGDSVTVLVDCVAGTPLSAKCTAYKGTTVRLDLNLEDPDGARVDLGTLKKTNEKASVVSFSKLKLARTGTYRLVVKSAAGTQGGFDLAISGAAPAKASGTGSIDTAGALAGISFDAVVGDQVTLTVKPAKKSKLKPTIVRFVDAAGGALTIGLPKQKTPVSVGTMGSSRFEVSGADGTTGAFTWSLKFARAKAPRTTRDAADLNAVGVIAGVVVVDGQVTRPSDARQKAAKRPRPAEVRPGELILSMPEARSFAEVEAAAAASMPGATCRVARAMTDTGPYLVRVEHLAARAGGRAKSATRALAKSARTSGTFEWCEGNGVVGKCEAEANDQYYVDQFNLRQLGLPFVWDRTEGDPNLVIAVVDTGMAFHPDLLQRWLPGYDFVLDPASSQDGDGWDGNPTDSALDHHGLHVAGIIGARSNNKTGMSGVVWTTKGIVPVRVLGKNGGTWFDVAAGLRWAAGLPVSGVPANDNPARVINMSLGAAAPETDVKVLKDAVAAVHSATTAVIVAAAGNDSSNTPFFPAAFANVISVYALDANQTWATYSNYGDWIMVGAPGGDPYRGQAGILSTFVSGDTGQPDYEELSGTSMASPQVAGVVALMIAMKPSLQRLEIIDILQKTARDLGPAGFDVDYGWGMADAKSAIDWVLTPYAPAGAIDVSPPALVMEGLQETAQIFVRRKTTQDPFAIDSITPSTDVGIPWLSASADKMTAPATLTVTVSPTLSAGVWTGKIRLATFLGIVDVPVRVVRAPGPRLNYVVVSAVADDGRVLAQASTSAAKNWAYTLEDVPLGRCKVTAVADMNGDLVVNRVDEWEGTWPILTQPQTLEITADSLDDAGINVPVTRYDSRFSYRGVGLGHVAGALSVRALDGRADRVIAGANVHLGGGAPYSVTDARGRGAIVANLTGPQTVTVVADGFGNGTRVGQDAQYASFALEPTTAAPTTTVVATVRGVSAFDKDVWIQVGDARGHLVYLGGSDPAFTLNVTNSYAAYPVTATVFDASGSPTRNAVFTVDALGATLDVPTTALPVGGAQARFVQPSAPTAGFQTSGATVVSTAFLRVQGSWADVGTSTLAFGQSRQGWWADPAVPDPTTPMKFEIVATDLQSRTSRRIEYGTEANLQPSSAAFVLDSPALLVSPANGASGVIVGPTLTWTTSANAGLHKIVVEEVGTNTRWTIWASGTTTSMALPTPSKGSLKTGTNYRWSVETLRFGGGFDSSNYREERLDTEPTSRTFSGWATFRTL